MRTILSLSFIFFYSLCVQAQNYTETIDTFYVPTPEYSVSLNLDSLHFPCAVTTPNSGNSFPILILVHGSSALDMDANTIKDFKDSVNAPIRKAQTRMFYEIADSLSNKGIMVLRYDKRSFTVNCIEKPACWFADTVSPYDYIKDLNYAVEFAKTLPKVDTCNIFVAGHSQGGSFVADAGYKRNDIRGVIGLAPTAQPVDTVVVFQTLTINNDAPGSVKLRGQFDSLRASLWPMNDTLYNQHFSPRFWLDWIDITDSAVITQKLLNAPTLFMYGTEDKAVPPSTHLQIWMDSIVRNDVTFMQFNDLDHGFGTIYDSTMSAEVLDSLSNWIHNNTCQSTGMLNSIETLKPIISPNPTSGSIFINNNSMLHAEVWSISGRKVYSGKIVNNEINISTLTAGVYIFRVSNATETYMYKIVKQ